MIEAIKTKRNIQIDVLSVFALALTLLYAQYYIAPMNSTTLAFSYEFGFIPRGLVGSIFSLLGHIIPGFYSSAGAFIFSMIMTVILYVVTILFIGSCFKKLSPDNSYSMFFIAMFLLWFMCPMFVGFSHLGRLDLYCILFTLGACFTILKDKFIYLCIPLCCLGVMTHEGYVFMFSGVVLALLLYKALQSEGKRRRDYIIVLSLTFISMSVLFIWFSFLYDGFAAPYYDVIRSNAIAFNKDSEVFDTVIDISILAKSAQSDELKVLPILLKQFLIFVVLMIPYLVLLGKFFSKLIRTSSKAKEKLSYLALALGIITILPELALKLDYGRWSFCIIFYFCVVIMLIGSIDNKVMNAIKEHLIPKNSLFLAFLMIYPVLFQPLLDTNVSMFTRAIYRMLLNLTA